jgi:GNAT superfamily N-acetyltransferase
VSFGSPAELYDHVAAELRTADERVVFLRFPSDLTGMAYAVANSGRHLVPAGGLVYWSLDVSAFVETPTPSGLASRPLRPADDSDVSAAIAAVADSFDGYTNHYSFNSELNARAVVAGYRQWAELTIRSGEDNGFVLEQDGDTIGIATVSYFHNYPDVCEVELAGLIAARQGGGRYRHLLAAVVAGARRRGCGTVVISTQSHNIRVQRAWASAGFKPFASLDTYHAVRTGRPE